MSDYMGEPNLSGSFFHALNIGNTIRELSPKQVPQDLWRKQPYLHESALTNIYLGFQEKQRVLYPQDLEKITNIFQWINNLHSKQFPQQEMIDGRQPLFISESDKSVMEMQIKKLQEADFLQQDNSMPWLNSILTSYVQKLTQAGIISDQVNIVSPERK